ncbi:MAG: hypothetical protein GXP48_06930 [Acidobacteria bacterium]|nr:hypothetical protein [Acidobacteriota bacterium]
MRRLSRRKLRTLVDQERVMKAIEEAENETSGEIRVSVAPFFWGNIHKAARRAFVRLGMTNTAERNGVLIFLVPARRKFVVLGDEGIHQKVGQAFWEAVAGAMSEAFRKGDFTGGLVKGIEEIGARLKAHFPHQPDDVNELPDTIDFGDSN